MTHTAQLNQPTTRIVALTRSGDRVEIPADELGALAAAIEGRVIGPDDADYASERRVWNGMIDHRPALIVTCASPQDVVAALEFARRHDLRMSVRAGGHNAAGAAVVDSGVVIDVRLMQAIEVDAESRIVRAGAGVTIGQLDAATQPFGLAVPQGVVTETGIAGLTLGGGVGWLRRQYGLSCDQLLSAEIVTADGRTVTASPDENPDLFWGIRGGGGNFGVVTSFEFRAHPVGPDVFFAFVVHPAERITETLRAYQMWADSAPPAVSSLAVLGQAPPLEGIPGQHHGRPVLILLAMHAGSVGEGEASLASLRALGTPVADLSDVTPFVEVQQFFDEDYPKWEQRYYWTSTYVHKLTDKLVDTLASLASSAPSGLSTIDLWQLGGAIAQVPAEATAFGERSAAFMVGIEANWRDPADDAVNMAWAREVVEATEPWSTGLRYANFPGLYEDDTATDFFGGNRRKMAAVKAAWDPHNIFNRNHNIAPAD